MGHTMQRNSNTPCGADPVARNESAFTFTEFHSAPESALCVAVTANLSSRICARPSRHGDSVGDESSSTRGSRHLEFEINGEPVLIRRESPRFPIALVPRVHGKKKEKKRESLSQVSNEKTCEMRGLCRKLRSPPFDLPCRGGSFAK